MPYCWKCGAELAEDAKCCPTCGTPVGPPEAEPQRRRERRPMSTFAIVLIGLIVVATVISAVAVIAFLPVRSVNAEPRRMSVPYNQTVETLNFSLTADVAYVNIAFEDLSGEWQSPLIIFNAYATARVGVFSSPDFLEHFMPVWHNKTEGNVLTVTVTQDVDGSVWQWHSSLNVTFDIRIDPSMNTSLDVKTSTGGIVMDTQAGVVFNFLNLEATTGGVVASLVEDVVVAGDVSVQTTTGGVIFSWDNVIATNDVIVDVETTTGGVNVNVKQQMSFRQNVTLKAEVTTGGVDFALDIRGDVGAKIESSTTLGGIDMERKVGFSGTEYLLQSNNYPAGGNFYVSLKTTTGGIDIDAKHTP